MNTLLELGEDKVVTVLFLEIFIDLILNFLAVFEL